MMEAVISGQAGRAVLINTHAAQLIMLERSAVMLTIPLASINRYFQGCTDIQTIHDTDEAGIRAVLAKAYIADREFRLCRIRDDDKEPEEVRAEAAKALMRLYSQVALIDPHSHPESTPLAFMPAQAIHEVSVGQIYETRSVVAEEVIAQAQFAVETELVLSAVFKPVADTVIKSEGESDTQEVAVPWQQIVGLSSN